MGLGPSEVKAKICIGICCFSSKHAALRSKNKNWLARNTGNKVTRKKVTGKKSQCKFANLAVIQKLY
jgi:hypothetical protein